MIGGVSILALVTEAFGGTGGIAQYNRDFLAAAAACRAVSLIVVVPRFASAAAELPISVKQATAHSARTIYVVAALRAALSQRFDVVFCGHVFMAPLALAIARLKGAKLVIQVHGIEAWTQPSVLCRTAVEAADLVLSVSRYTRGRVLKWAALEPERVRVLPNTVREPFTPGEAGALRANWGLADKRILLSVGRLSSRERYKGHDRVIEAIPQFVARGYDAVYVIVGEGDDRGRLEALADQLKVTERVRFVGALEETALVDVYRMADLFVMPSSGEGFGIAFLEAMACGTPALGLAAAGAVDALADGELGAAVAESEFVDAVCRLLDAGRPDPARLAAKVTERFGRQAFAAQAETLLARLLASDNSRAETVLR